VSMTERETRSAHSDNVRRKDPEKTSIGKARNSERGSQPSTRRPEGIREGTHFKGREEVRRLVLSKFRRAAIEASGNTLGGSGGEERLLAL